MCIHTREIALVPAGAGRQRLHRSPHSCVASGDGNAYHKNGSAVLLLSLVSLSDSPVVLRGSTVMHVEMAAAQVHPPAGGTALMAVLGGSHIGALGSTI